VTIREALAQNSAVLKAAGIDTPSLDASLLLAHILNTNRTALTAMGNDPLSEESSAVLRALTDRRKKGECTAYILGKKEFRDLEFLVNPSVLVPRPDTETLVEAALEVIMGSGNRGVGSGEWGVGNGDQGVGSGEWGMGNNGYRVLDLCTGSGAVAISLKNEMPALEVWATDISDEALDTAKKNAVLLLPPDSINFFQSDLYNALPIPHSQLPTPSFNLIVCNPPYIPTGEMRGLPAEVRNEPRIALDGGEEGMAIIRRVIEGSVERLKRGGALLLEADPRQMEKIAFLLEKWGFNNIKLYRDLSGKERVIGGIHE
jgi:release factor glutamine methyltransferase